LSRRSATILSFRPARQKSAGNSRRNMPEFLQAAFWHPICNCSRVLNASAFSSIADIWTCTVPAAAAEPQDAAEVPPFPGSGSGHEDPFISLLAALLSPSAPTPAPAAPKPAPEVLTDAQADGVNSPESAPDAAVPAPTSGEDRSNLEPFVPVRDFASFLVPVRVLIPKAVEVHLAEATSQSAGDPPETRVEGTEPSALPLGPDPAEESASVAGEFTGSHSESDSAEMPECSRPEEAAEPGAFPPGFRVPPSIVTLAPAAPAGAVDRQPPPVSAPVPSGREAVADASLRTRPVSGNAVPLPVLMPAGTVSRARAPLAFGAMLKQTDPPEAPDVGVPLPPSVPAVERPQQPVASPEPIRGFWPPGEVTTSGIPAQKTAVQPASPPASSAVSSDSQTPQTRLGAGKSRTDEGLPPMETAAEPAGTAVPDKGRPHMAWITTQAESSPPAPSAEPAVRPHAPRDVPILESTWTEPDNRPWEPAAREISLHIPGKPSEAVQVDVKERAGEVQVDVRTHDSELAGVLRDNVSDLVTRLERTGYDAEIWTPGDPLTSRAASDSGFQSNSEENQSRQYDRDSSDGRQQERQRREQQRQFAAKELDELISGSQRKRRL
jgi:hypothetical protein